MKLSAKEVKPNRFKRIRRLDWEDWLNIGLVVLTVGYVAFQVIRAKIGA